MANDLDEVREIFIKTTHRYDLITGGDFTVDNGANAWLNRGQDWLDRMVDHPMLYRRTHRALAAAAFQIEVQRLIAVRKIAIVESSGDATGHSDITDFYLEPGEFREVYSTPIASWSTGEPKAWTLNIAGLDPEHEAKETADYTSDGVVDFDDVIFGEGAYADYVKQGILFHPKADTAYTVYILGKFLSPILTADADKTFWTVNEPMLLALAGAYMLESTMRNRAGTRAYLEAMEPLLTALDIHAVEHDQSAYSISIMEG